MYQLDKRCVKTVQVKKVCVFESKKKKFVYNCNLMASLKKREVNVPSQTSDRSYVC